MTCVTVQPLFHSCVCVFSVNLLDSVSHRLKTKLLTKCLDSGGKELLLKTYLENIGFDC